jgi:hypothetical protein
MLEHNPHFQKLLKKEMSRKEFLFFCLLAIGGIVGLGGLLKQLTSSAATPFVTSEPENGTVKTPAKVVADATASGGKAVQFTAPAPPPPPTTSKMFLGVTAGTVNVDSDWRKQNMPWLENKFGRMGIRRTFQSNIPSSFSSTYAGGDLGVRASWQSIRSDWNTTMNGAYDAAITAYLKTIPSDHMLLLTWCHEPENDGGSAANFRSSATHVYRLVKTVRPQTLVGPISMGWTFDSRSGRNPNDWMPDPSVCDFVGVDPYQNYLYPLAGAPKKWDPSPDLGSQGFMHYAKDIWHIQPALAETACGVYRGTTGTGPDDFNMKRDWIKSTVEYYETNGALAFCYFDTNVNNDLAPKCLLEDDSTTGAYWSSILKTHTRGVV